MRRWRFWHAIIWLLLTFGATVQTAVAQVPASCAKLVRAAESTGAAGTDIASAMETIERLRQPPLSMSVRAYAKFGQELISVADPFLGGNDAISAADMISITVHAKAPTLTDAELAAAFDALFNYLRQGSPSGPALIGVELKTGSSDGSTRLIKNLAGSNRGFFFEAAGTRSIIQKGIAVQGRAIGVSDLAGMGVVATDGVITVEGDLVVNAGVGLGDFIDFKAFNGNFTENEIQRAVEAILKQASGQLGFGTIQVNSFTFAVEDSTNLSSVTTSDTGVNFLSKFNELKATLPPDLQSKLDIIQVPFL